MDEEYENQLFEIKSRFLREVPHPKLIRKGMEQARVLAGDTLTEFETGEEPSNEALQGFLVRSVEHILRLKLAVSQASTANELYNGLRALYVTQMALLQKLACYLPVLTRYPDDALKVSAPVDGYAIWRFINANGLSEDEIKPYICTSLESGIPGDDVLTTACLRSRKIIANE